MKKNPKYRRVSYAQNVEAPLGALPPNLPETKLTAKQRRLVREMYDKYIGDDGAAARKELRDPWPTGPKVKLHEAQRTVLRHLYCLTKRPSAAFFLGALGSKETYQQVVRYVYDTRYA